MRATLQRLAAVIAIGATAFWIFRGAHWGWNKNRVEIIKGVDEITGIEQKEWQDKFVPGFEFLGIAWLGALALTGVSLMIRKQPKQTTGSTK